MADIVKTYARRIGLDSTLFSGRSLRAGFLTSAAQHGASIFKLMEVSRYYSLDTLSGYVCDAEFSAMLVRDFFSLDLADTERRLRESYVARYAETVRQALMFVLGRCPVQLGSQPARCVRWRASINQSLGDYRFPLRSACGLGNRLRSSTGPMFR